MEDYPNRIYEHRKARGLSQEALAVAINPRTTKMSISRMERGLQPITLDDLREIGRVLGVNPADLLAAADNPLGPRSDSEAALIDRYRAADPERREDLDRVMDALVPFRGEDRKTG